MLDIGGAHGITKVSFNVNDYVEWARNVVDAVSAKNGDVSAAGYTDAEYKRAQKLNLTEGEICDFDFYYMERHGYGANCRIATNMHITDPSLDVGKQAYQFGDAVETGGVVDTSSSIEYSFQLTNTGNTKLYNLTFADDVIGVTLDPYAETADKALVIAAGSTAQDAHGGTLEAKDLTALVKSYKPVEGGKYVKDTTEGTYVIAPEGTTGTHDYVEIPVTFANETELWNFLKTLSGKGLETSVTDEEVTQSGSGLWVDSTVIIRGIYYKMTDAQIKEGVLNNTVYVTATTKISPASAGNKTLRSDASHRVYKSAAPVYYQWAGHELFVSGQKLLDDARTEANKGETSVLYQYATFLNKTTNASNVYFRLSDKTSYVTTYAGITSKTINGTWGYLINHQKPGTYSFYLTIFDKSMAGKRIAQMDADTYAFMRVTVYVTDTQDCTYVLDYGLQTEDLNTDGGLFANDELLGSSSDTTAKVMGITKTAPTYQNATTYTGDYNRLNLTGASTASKVEFDDGYITTPGATTIGYAGGKYTLPSAINFTPTKFMDGVYTMWMGLSVYSNEDIKKTSTAFTPSALGAAVDINNEVQMYKKITVLPATVVYYEDDFVGISYNKTGGNTFSHYGTGSGSLNQSVNQAQPYGQDKVYQDSSNSQYSGNSLSVFEIRNTTDVATFSFTGTGFELISRTNATDTATIVIGVYNQAEYASYAAGDTDKPTAVKLIPVITQFDNGNDGGDEAIYQVPTVRINDLTSGSYTVEISGNPTYDFSKWDGTTENLSACVLPTYLYIDGLRIYQPLGTSNDNYSDGENGAVFTELRSLIVEGKVAVAELSLNTLTVSTGTTTWTENLHDDTFDSQNSATYVGNKVGSSSDYLIQGPNNEVYMDGTVSNAAIVMYVQESGTGAHTLQIAARALDYAQFYGAETSGLKVKLQYGVKKADDSYDWEPLVTITSGTEQYYSIPYDQCPVVDGKYQVVIRAVNADTSTPAMVSYSTVKTVGLDIVKVDGNGEATDLYFQNGILVTPDYYLCGTINGTEVEAASDEAYRFAKGKLTVTFTADSTVAVARKLGTTVTQYKAGSTTLTATTTLTTANTNAITVPQGTYQFTLTENKDGTLTLTATAVVDTVDEEINDEIPTAMNMIAIKEQLSAGMPTGDTETEVILPTLELCYPTLAFEDEIQFNVYFSAIDTDDVVQMGLITFDSMLTEGTMEDALEVIPGFVAEDGLYRVHTNGIPAKNLGDVLHFKVYAQLSDGSYVYSDVACYSAVTYANRVLSGAAGDESVKPLVVAMLNYGAAAQQFFGYNTDALINAGLTAQEQAWVAAYDQSMVAPVTPADSSKLGDFASKGGFARQYPSISFEGAFSINYYFVPEHTVDGEMTFYYWSEEAYAAADALTAGNATKVVSITGSEYIGVVEGIAAKELDSTVYVAAVYKSDGTTYCTGVLAYSLGAYCVSQVNSSDPAMQTFAAATAVYGYCAKTYFAN